VKSKKIIWKEKAGSKLNVIKASLLFLRDYIYLIFLYRLEYFKKGKNAVDNDTNYNDLKERSDFKKIKNDNNLIFNIESK